MMAALLAAFVGQTTLVYTDSTADRTPPLSEEAADIFHALGSSATDADALAEHLDMPVAEVQRVLLVLEMQRLVARDATGGYHKA